MRPYWAIFSGRFRTLLQYRAAALGGFGCQLFFGYVIVMGYRAFYAASDAPQPMSIEQVVSYIWLGQAMLGLLPWIPDREVAALVRTGDVAYELLRPVDLYWFWFNRSVANRVAPTLLRAVPMFVVAFAYLGLQAPASWPAGLAWGAATIGAALLASAITTFFGICLFWTVSGEGFAQIVPCFVTLCSGMLVPFPLLPGWLRRIFEMLPFRGVVDIPFRLYTGDIPASRLAPMLAIQVFWIVAIMSMGKWLLARGARRLVVQGG